MVEKTKSASYFRRCLSLLPSYCTSLCSNRMSVAFFCLSGLDVIQELENQKDIKDIINWIYSFQIIPKDSRSRQELMKCGFRGSLHATNSFHQIEIGDVRGVPSTCHLDTSHIAMTYTGLCSLLILGDDLKGVDREAVLAGVQALQLEDGNFCATLGGSESDMRFVYCAAAVSYILDDWSGLDRELVSKFIVSSLSYDGGIGEKPDHESHGGLTYCGVAALDLMGTLHSALSRKQLSNLKKWCLMRQADGFRGRPNKPPDTCYSFWIGATLKILDAYNFVDVEANHKFTMSTYAPYVGGFAKWPDSIPDPLHSYLGLAGLSLAEEKGLSSIHPSLNITLRAFEHLQVLQKSWRK